jgi:invasion protein IalB
MRTAALAVLLAAFFVEGYSRAATLTPISPPGAEALAPQNLKISTNPGWASKCMSDSRKGPLVCSVEETLVLASTGQAVASVALRTQTDTHQTIMLIRVPVGLYLPAGISFQIDEGKDQTATVQTCDLQGCLAEA